MVKTETVRCTECERPVVNRLVDNCLYCGAELHAEIKLTKQEKARLREREMRKLDAERKARTERDEEHANGIGLGSSDSSWAALGLFGIMGLLD